MNSCVEQNLTLISKDPKAWQSFTRIEREDILKTLSGRNTFTQWSTIYDICGYPEDDPKTK